MNELQWVLWHYKEIKLVKKDYLNLGHKNRSFKSRLRIWQEAEDGKFFSVGVPEWFEMSIWEGQIEARLR